MDGAAGAGRAAPEITGDRVDALPARRAGARSGALGHRWAVHATPHESHLPLMVLIHFVDEEVGEPLCRRPERTNWLWAVDPDSVTCAGCWRGVEKRGVREPPVRVVLNEV